ncbi:hypothetical protein EDD18DRAFT_38940 [Armillaria luteobubalina]|uniref:DUF6534 domain-containing protein n=1 Tax=Armillaria luteobubalina TaxID=153913 RepID=A0AA39QPA3_9AGAR|nr:hypothetical protein EDD18DRAFT_38940 [Armillaria luteobubalina]
MDPIETSGMNVLLLAGPLLLGYMWGSCLYGVLLVQFCLYYHQCNDPRGVKIFVWLLFVVETTFAAFSNIAAWNNFGKDWGNTDTLYSIDWSWKPLTPLNGFIALMAQSFYVWRIWILTRNHWTCIIIECIAVMQCAVAFYLGITVVSRKGIIQDLHSVNPIISLWLLSSAACDLMITASIVSVLWRARANSKFRSTSKVVTKLIWYTIETGLITSLAVILQLTLWLTSSQYNFHFICFFTVGKLYSNTLLATLNSRALIFGGSNSTIVSSVSLRWDVQSDGEKAPYYSSSLATESGNDVHEMVVSEDLGSDDEFDLGKGTLASIN